MEEEGRDEDEGRDDDGRDVDGREGSWPLAPGRAAEAPGALSAIANAERHKAVCLIILFMCR
ncbi:MAG: hypothetical protein HDS56_06340 [Barnesiella sp.]|nr:hypothetical protein [Bacteroidales bacterium]MBD5250777.1 hypothetical protein [Barnesiella sp.]MBD5253962.1 hypothetical protein [Barnesiella sp.]